MHLQDSWFMVGVFILLYWICFDEYKLHVLWFTAGMSQRELAIESFFRKLFLRGNPFKCNCFTTVCATKGVTGMCCWTAYGFFGLAVLNFTCLSPYNNNKLYLYSVSITVLGVSQYHALQYHKKLH